MRITRRGVTALILVLSLLTLPAAVAPEGAASEVPTAEVTGRGFLSALACAGCVAGGVAIASGGIGAILVAVNTSGSFWAAAACAGACIDALR